MPRSDCEHGLQRGSSLSQLIERESDVSRYLQPVVLGGDLLTYTYVREFHRAYGIQRTIVLATLDVKQLSSSKFTDYRLCPNIHEPKPLYAELKKIADEFHGTKQLLVVGSDDCHARMLSKGKDYLESLGYVVPYIDFDLLDDITQKERFYRICEQLDIPYPQTQYFDCSDRTLEIPADSFTYPVIAKPSNSATFQDATIAHKKKIYEISDADEMRVVWSQIRDSDYEHELIVQDYVPGDDDEIRTLTTFSDAEGNVRVVSGGIVCLQDHDPTALGNPVCILGEKQPEIIDAAKRFLRHVHYRGFANFDIKYDRRDGTFKFFEVNTRCGRNTFYMSLGGVCFVKLFVDEFILHKQIPYTEAYDPFLFCVVPWMVLERSMTNKERLEQARNLWRGHEHYPLHYAPDSLEHNFWARVMWENQILKFKRFYWDTNGKQLDV